MSGVAVILELLLADADVVAAVGEDWISADDFGIDIELPAIQVAEVSAVDFQTLTLGSKVHVTERVQVTVMSVDYPGQKYLIRLVRKACQHKRGDFAGVTEVSVLTVGRNPDFRSPSNVRQQSQDFSVSFNEPA